MSTKIYPIAAMRAVGDPNGIILDVRHDDEWAVEHADRAVHFDVARMENGEMPNISRRSFVYVYCFNGDRAERATEILYENGWEHVTNIGGLSDWEAAGGGMVSGTA